MQTAVIGETAGKIWQTLNQKGEINLAQLPKAIQEKSAVAYQALGWLAREDKIAFRNDSRKTFVVLK